MWEFITSPTLRLFLNLLWSALVFVAGAYCGYRFNVWQDKRREFNERRDKVFPLLTQEIEDPDPLLEAITKNEFEVLWWLVYPWHRKGFSKSFAAYEAAKSGNTKMENYSVMLSYIDPEPVKQAAANLLTYLKRR